MILKLIVSENQIFISFIHKNKIFCLYKIFVNEKYFFISGLYYMRMNNNAQIKNKLKITKKINYFSNQFLNDYYHQKGNSLRLTLKHYNYS